jgi:peptidoglycan/LPS O-acetylase OafA/YrhL
VAFLAANIVVAAAMGRDLGRVVRSAATALTYTANWAPSLGWGLDRDGAHLWSLSVEEQFYLVWPFVLLLGLLRLPRRWALAAITVAVVGIAIWRAVLTARYGSGYPVVYQRTDTRFDAILVGAMVALVPWRATPTRRMANLLTLGGGAVLAYWVLRPEPVPDALFRGGFTVVAVAAAAVLVGLLEGTAPVTRALSARPLVELGRLSYSLYLWHLLAFSIARDLGPTLSTRVLLGVVLAFGFATASYLAVERPMLAAFGSARPAAVPPQWTVPGRVAAPLRGPRRRLHAALGAGIVVVGLAGAAGASGMAAKSAVDGREREAAARVAATQPPVTTVTAPGVDVDPTAPTTTAGTDPGAPDGPSDGPAPTGPVATPLVPTTLTIDASTGPSVPAVGSVEVAARLATEAGEPLAGQRVAFEVRVADRIVGCQATTDVDGTARCRVPLAGELPGAVVVHAAYRGDAQHEPAIAERRVVVDGGPALDGVGAVNGD